MTYTTSPPASRGSRGSRSARREARALRPPGRRRAVVLVLVVLVLAVLGFAGWLAAGLLSASRTVQDKAGVAQTELQAFRDALESGDRDVAAAHLTSGRAQLERARSAAQQSQVRIAAHLPWLGQTVADLDHLLAAADIMTASGANALEVYDDFSGDDSQLYRAGVFSLPAIGRAQQSVTAIGHSMDRAQHELDQVHGNGPKGAQALEKKRTALAQIASLRSEIVSLGPLLDALPAAVGGSGPKTYLVAVMNPAEMRASGGAPLSVAFVHFKNGKMTIPLQGTTSELTHGNQKTTWKSVPDDPWQRPGPQRFVNANFNPSFPVSAEQMARATPSNFSMRADGVIALDIVAISHLLEVTGPIESDAYGTLTAGNVARKLLVNAYQKQGGDASGRHDVNNELMSIMLSRLTEGGGLIGKAKALGKAVPGRHLQLYFHDAGLQQLMVDKHLAGEVPLPDVGNVSAVYTQNSNASKMDVFQQRTVRETVQLRPDGSAQVRRTVVIHNDSPPFLGPGAVDARVGYGTRWAGDLVISMMPAGARITGAPERGAVKGGGSVSRITEGVDQAGRTYGQASVLLPPKGTASLTWTYVVDHATIPHGRSLRLLDYVGPQSMLHSPALELTVVAPQGWRIERARGWKVAGDKATRTVAMNAPSVVKVQVAPPG